MLLATEGPTSSLTHLPHIPSNQDIPWRGFFMPEVDITTLIRS